MNNDQTPTKSDNVFVPSSPVFKHIKVRKKKGQPTCNDNDDPVTTDKIIIKQDTFKKDLYDSESAVKNILSNAKNLEYLNRNDKMSNRNKKCNKIMSHGFQKFSTIANLSHTQIKPSTSIDYMTDSELLSTTDLLQDFATKTIDFSQWTGNTESLCISPKPLNSKVSRTGSRNIIINDFSPNVDEDADIKEFNGFESEVKTCKFSMKNHLFNSLPITQGVSRIADSSNSGEYVEICTNSQSPVTLNSNSKTISKILGVNNKRIKLDNLIKEFSRFCNEDVEIEKENSFKVQSARSNIFSKARINDIDMDKIILNENKLEGYKADEILKQSLTSNNKFEDTRIFSNCSFSTKKTNDHIVIPSRDGSLTSKCETMKHKNEFFNKESKNYTIIESQIISNNKKIVPVEKTAKQEKSFLNIEDNNRGEKNHTLNNLQSTSGKKTMEFEQENEKIFSTSTNSNLNNSLYETKKIFDESDEFSETSKQLKYSKDNEIKEFHASNNKQDFTVGCSLYTDKSLFEGIECVKEESAISTEERKSIKSKKNMEFQWASGKKCFISKESLVGAKKLFEDDTSLTMQNISIDEIKCCKKSENVGFQMAIDKKCLVSNDPSNKSLVCENAAISKSSFDETETLTKKTAISLKVPESTKNDKFMGFQSARGKKYVLSNDALEKAKKLLEDDGSFNVVNPSSNNIDFQPESDKKYSTSDDIFKKPNKLLQHNKTSHKKYDSTEEICSLKNEEFIGFQTASGKKFTISNDALKKAKKLLEDDGSCSDGDKSGAGDEFVGFLSDNSLKNKLSKIKGVSHNEDNSIEAIQSFKNEFTGCQSESSKKCVSEINTKETNSTKTDKFMEFQSASGKNCFISGESLQIAKKLFEENDSSYKGDCAFGKVQPFKCDEFIGFQSASGKKCMISNDALEKAKKLLEDDGLSSNKGITSRDADKSSEKLEHSASSKQFSMPKTSSIKTNKLFEDNKLTNETKICETKSIKKDTFIGFQSASGKPYLISNESLAKAKKLLEDDESFNVSSTSRNKVENNEFASFQSASGKKMFLSDDSLNKANKLFEEYGCSHKGYNNVEEVELLKTDENVKHGNSDIFSGFQSASGKKHVISNDSLRKAKKLLENDENFIIKNPSGQEDQFRSNHEIADLQTSSGKTCFTSDNSLNKAKKLFEDSESSQKGDGSIEKEEAVQIDEFVGFQSASGKKCSISKNSLENVKKLFENNQYIAPETDISIDDIKFIGSDTSMGFKSACGKKIIISNDSLKEAKKLFEDNETSHKDGNSIEKENALQIGKFVGFQAASGKKCPISKTSLEKAKKLLENNEHLAAETDISIDDINLTDSDSFMGFKSASDKKCIISNDTLKKAKELFEDHESSGKADKRIKEINVKCKEVMGLQSENVKKCFISNNGNEFSIAQCKESKSSKNNEFMQNQSANSNQYDVSKESLIKAHQSSVNNKESESTKNSELGMSSPIVVKEHMDSKCFFDKDELLKTKEAFNISLAEDYENNIIWKLTSSRSPKNNVDDQHTQMEKTSLKRPLSPILMKTPHLMKKSKITSTQLSAGVELDINKYNLNYENLSQEIKESTFALMADDSIFGGSLVTSPTSFLNDVSNTIKPILINDDITEKEQLFEQCAFNKTLGPNDLYTNQIVEKNLEQTFESEVQIKKIQSKSFKIPLIPGCDKMIDNLKRKGRDMNLDYATPFTKGNKDLEFENVDEEILLLDTQILTKLDEREVSEEVRAMRNMSYEKQKLMFKNVKRKKIDCKLLRGSYLTNKTGSTERISWIKYTDGLIPQNYDRETLLYKFHLKKTIVDVTTQNINDFVFSGWDYYSIATCKTNTSGIKCGDGALLILDENSNITLERIVTGFLTSPGVDSNLVSELWVKNHFKWIVLKLAAMERNFPALFANKACIPHNLMLQLKYRFDREIDKVEKSCLKKILQTDDTPAKPMILYCANVYKISGESNNSSDMKQILYEIELSDGWYSIRTKIDPLLSKLIVNEKFKIGDKIYVVGSVLLNCVQGCDPLEVPVDVRLQIFSNSSRRARWDERLGFTGLPPLLPCLGTVHHLGGIIHLTEFVVVRRYPMIYLVKYNGKTKMHSEKLELKLAEQYEKKKSEEMEKIYSQVRNSYEQEFLDQSKLIPVREEKDINKIRCPEELFNLMRASCDPTSFQERLTDSQKSLVLQHFEKKQNDITSEIFNKVQNIVSSNEEISKRSSHPLLKLRVIPLCRDSNPKHNHSVIISIWRPNASILKLLLEEKCIRACNCTAESIRNGDLQISAGRHASFRAISNKHQIGFKSYPFRRFTSITDMYKISFEPDFNEVDTVGVVCYISTYRNENSFQSVYIADLNKKIIEISFWGGIQHHGYENLIKLKSIIACSNLQWRKKNSSRQILFVYVTDLSIFSTNPQQNHLKDIFNNYQQSLENVMDQFITECKNILCRLKTCSNTTKAYTPERKQPFECRKTPIQKRLDVLSNVPNPPQLSSVTFKTPTKLFTKPFKSPMLVNTKMNTSNSSRMVDSPPLSLE